MPSTHLRRKCLKRWVPCTKGVAARMRLLPWLLVLGCWGFVIPYGIRPLVYGSRETENGTEYMLASESVALDILGYTRIDDVAPGEAIFISNAGRNLPPPMCCEVQSSYTVHLSNMFTSPAQIPSSTTFLSIRAACGWVSIWRGKYLVSFLSTITTSTWSSQFPTPAEPQRYPWLMNWVRNFAKGS